MSKFRLAKNRDAWFVIRGYRYQVDLSITRWLSLDTSQQLMLEFGEDIDVVNNAVAADEPERKLEQIKHLDTNVTLRSAPCLCALANAVQHFASNPEIDIRFRFCTNAKPGIERPSIFDTRLSGIVTWENHRSNNRDTLTRKQLGELNTMLVFLRSLAKPDKGVEADTWNAFVEFLRNATAQSLLEFIRKFEWSTGEPDADDLSNKIVVALQDRVGVRQDKAQLIYARLFLHVMQVLSQSGVKVLSRHEIEAIISLPSLTAESERQLSFLASQVLVDAKRLDELELTTARQELALAEIRNNLLELFGDSDVPVHLSTAVAEISTNLPPLVGFVCSRAAAVAEISAKIEANSWFAIYGTVGCGKTQLVSLIGSKMDSVTYVSLRDLNTAEANFLLHHLFKQLCCGEPEGSVVNSGLNALPRGGVLILDDVPRLLSGDQLSQRLVMIANNVAARNQKLLTVSHYEVPANVWSLVTKDRFFQVRAPRLESTDVKELFEFHGAFGAAISDLYAEFYAVNTSGNPTLLAAYARTMQANGWDTIEEYTTNVARNNASPAVIGETVFRLLKTVEAPETRELLYRLCVIRSSFGTTEAATVAEVPPAISRLNESVSKLDGLWIERLSPTASVVCPLILQFGCDELNKDVRRAVAKELSTLIFAGASVSPLEFARGIRYLRIAEEGVELAFRVLYGLQSVCELPVAWQKLVLKTTSDVSLYTRCPDTLRLMIMARQIILADELEELEEDLVAAAMKLVSSPKLERLGAAAFAIQTAATIAKFCLNDGLYLCKVALDNIDDIIRIVVHSETSDVASAEAPTRQLEGSLLWFLVAELNNADDLQRWFEVFKGRPRNQIERILSSDLATDGFRLALDRLWMLQHELPKASQEFGPILKAYDAIQSFCSENDLPLFEAMAIRSKIIVMAEYLNKVNESVSLGKQALQRFGTSKQIAFLINDVVGRQLVYAKRFKEAVIHLTVACAIHLEQFAGIRLRSLLELSRAIGDSDCNLALSAAIDAVKLGRTGRRGIAEAELVVALGEAAIAAWYANDRALAFDCLDEAFASHFRTREDGIEWKMKAALLEHSLGYMSSVVMFGNPPSADFHQPPRGKLLGFNRTMAEWYDESRTIQTIQTPALLVNFAVGVGRIDRAVYWANQGIDDARNHGALASVSILSEAIVPSLIETGDMLAAFDYGNEAAIALIAASVAHEQTGGKEEMTLNALDVLGEKPAKHWNDAEQRFVYVTIIPAMLSLLTRESAIRTGLELLGEECRRRTEDASAPEAFDSIADAIHSFLQGASSDDLRKRGSACDSNAPQLVCYLLSSFAKGAMIEHAVVNHAVVFHSYSRQTTQVSVLWAFCGKLLLEYWVQQFSEARFKFSNPKDVQNSLDRLCKLQPHEVVKPLICCMLDGMSVRLPKSLSATSAWLRS